MVPLGCSYQIYILYVQLLILLITSVLSSYWMLKKTTRIMFKNITKHYNELCECLDVHVYRQDFSTVVSQDTQCYNMHFCTTGGTGNVFIHQQSGLTHLKIVTSKEF